LYGLQNILIMKTKIQFANKDKLILTELNQHVDNYLRSNNLSKYATSGIHLKALIFFLLYLFCSIYIYFTSNITQLFLCYICMGPLTVFLALNIGHEAAHNIFSKNKKLNKLLVFVFDFLGASGRIWKYKHVHSHHLHTNIHQLDLELQQPKLVRIFPRSKFLSIHRYQHLYMPFLYSIYTLVWFFFRDYSDFLKYKNHMSDGKPIKEACTFLLGKILFLLRMIVLPSILLDFGWGTIICAFLLLNIIASITVTFALISTHVGEHSEFPVPDSNGKLEHSWLEHQFLTTCDFSTDNKLITFFYGGFNHHLTHHLFPFVSHAHYPEITKIIKRISSKYEIANHPQPTIYAAIKSHLKLLKRRAKEGKKTLAWMEM